LGSDRPKVLDDALVVVDDLIANLTHALEHAAEVQDRAAASARVAESTRRRYQELYELIPLPYLRTDNRGTGVPAASAPRETSHVGDRSRACLHRPRRWRGIALAVDCLAG
jgi:hypothetical protein